MIWGWNESTRELPMGLSEKGTPKPPLFIIIFPIDGHIMDITPFSDTSISLIQQGKALTELAFFRVLQV